MTLFDYHRDRKLQDQAPLASRMRPRTFEEFVGQEHIIGPGRVLRRTIESDQLPSIILWGPPGTGKTTLAHVVAAITQSHFSPISAVTSGVRDLRQNAADARERLGGEGRRPVRFIGEINQINQEKT